MCICETDGLSKFSEKSDGQSVNRDRYSETETLASGVKQRSEESLEKAFKIKEVPEQFKGEILLNIPGERVNNLLVHVSEEELNNYTDSNFKVPGKINLLLVANIFYELLKPERIKIKDSQLLLVNSVLGYIVMGNLDSINETKVHCGLIRVEDLNKTLENFWEVEEVAEPIVKNKERLICEEHYANTHFRTKEGKYVVSMPLKKEPSCLGNSKDIALKRLGDRCGIT
ncbi:uncharacterized protein TNCV_3840621 [Trichonephila clavipes]|nr:uncharacterized protein TNCV_3840621 [Trichonephila clavipes]